MTIHLEQFDGLADDSLASGARLDDTNSVESVLKCVDSPIALGGRPTLAIDNLLGLKHLASLPEGRVGQRMVDIEKGTGPEKQPQTRRLYE